MTNETCHIPVLTQEVLEGLAPEPGKFFIDGTFGGGGHTLLLAKAVMPGGRIIALDRDPEVFTRKPEELASLPVDFAVGNYCDLPDYLHQKQITGVDGILLDLGLSGDQLADSQRGFSFQSDGPLDLRFNTEEGEPAWKLLARLKEEPLANLIYEYGEERFSRRIAKQIVQRREESPIRTTGELADLVRRCIPGKVKSRIDPATRTFQALRIAVNQELEALRIALRDLPDCLNKGGRMVIISFHSLEDRMVKWAFRDDERLHVITRRPLEATDQELAANPRARSAKLRIAERTE
ncbi:16S rRNA (cytosine(1402)-N(4))-methyltransferase RsmH [Adhaeretor mobilis]|nr:16S rRNA (cytosine(1402)-N(4))-methyltransferase RsmH [Adhaeretor mobilis]